MALMKTSEMFAERERLFLITLRKQLPWRHTGSGLRQHIHSHIKAIRSMRDARAEYTDGLSNRRLGR